MIIFILGFFAFPVVAALVGGTAWAVGWALEEDSLEVGCGMCGRKFGAIYFERREPTREDVGGRPARTGLTWLRFRLHKLRHFAARDGYPGERFKQAAGRSAL